MADTAKSMDDIVRDRLAEIRGGKAEAEAAETEANRLRTIRLIREARAAQDARVVAAAARRLAAAQPRPTKKPKQ